MRLKSYYSASFTQAARHPGADEVVFALSEPFLRSGEPPALKRNGSTGDRSADLYDPEMARPYQTLIAKDVEPALAQELLTECAGETQPIKLRRALRERKRPPTDAYPVPEQLPDCRGRAAKKSSDRKLAVERFSRFHPSKLLFTHFSGRESRGDVFPTAAQGGTPVSFLAPANRGPRPAG